MGISYNPGIVTNGLVGYWDAGNPKSYPGSGTTWSDLSGNRYNGTLANSPTFSSDNGGNFAFNGSSQRVSVPYTAGLAPTAQISYEAFAYLANWNITSDIRILSKTEGGGYHMALNDGTILASSLGGVIYAGGAYRAVKISRTLLSSGWHHVAFTFDGQYYKMYLDGINVDTYNHGSVTTLSYSNSNHLVVGAEAGTGTNVAGNYWSGKIASVKVYNRGLTENEVERNFGASRGRFGI